MALVITIDGDANVINQGLAAYVKYHGYTETVSNDNYDPNDPSSLLEIPNPVTMLEYANDVLAKMFRSDIKSWNIAQAQAQAASQAAGATDSALDLTSVSTEVTSG